MKRHILIVIITMIITNCYSQENLTSQVFLEKISIEDLNGHFIIKDNSYLYPHLGTFLEAKLSKTDTIFLTTRVAYQDSRFNIESIKYLLKGEKRILLINKDSDSWTETISPPIFLNIFITLNSKTILILLSSQQPEGKELQLWNNTRGLFNILSLSKLEKELEENTLKYNSFFD